MIPGRLRAEVEAWIRDDPDAGDRAELRALLAASGREDEAGQSAAAEIADRFAGRLTFGTAGLRGAIGAGPNRMNAAVVRAATAALARWLRDHDRGGAAAGVVIGCDARHRSARFADEAAAVLAGAGTRVHLLPRPCPTPLLAFAVRHLAAAAGIMITASHNPRTDNGYKLYLRDGAQIVPPVDEQIAAAIAGIGPLRAIPAGPAGAALTTRHGDEVAQAYLDAVVTACPRPVPAPPGLNPPGPPGPNPPGPPGPNPPGPPGPNPPGPPGPNPPALPALPRVVYTPLHGVAAGLALRAVKQAGFGVPVLVTAQAEPDPDFPTVAFPNPEEPGTMDLAIETASRHGADLVLANDPDGDRLAVAVPGPRAGDGWRVLTGDQVGALLGAYLLERTAGEPQPGQRLVVTTVVSSTLLAKIAARAGVHHAQTLTGFKWIVRAGQALPGSRFVFGYEEALGYAVGETVRDKDGISAALAVLSLLASARAAGRSLLNVWDSLESEHGVHLTGHLTLPTRFPQAIMARLRAGPPATLAGQPITATGDLASGDAGLPAADVLVYHLPGARVVIRPSGTEPRLKAYLEVVEPATDQSLTAARARAAGRLQPLRQAVAALVAAAGPGSGSGPDRTS